MDGRSLAELLVENGLARVHGMKVTLPDGTKSAEYLGHLGELETSAREKKLGAWMHSVPAVSHPAIEEVKEVLETPRWLERAGFAGLGAAGMGMFWSVSHWRERRRRRRFNGPSLH